MHLKFATAVFFEMSKGLVIIYVKKGWGGGEGGRGGEGGEGGGRRRENLFGRSKSLPSRPCKWHVSLLPY